MLGKHFVFKYAIALSVCIFAGCTGTLPPYPQRTSTPPITVTEPTNTSETINIPSLTVAPLQSPTSETVFQGSIVFTNISQEYSGIALLNLETSNIEDLSGSGSDSLSWSPDSQWIAFNGGVPPSQRIDLYIIKRDGSGLKQLTNSSQGKYDIDWSPDGKFLVYAYNNHVQPSELALFSLDNDKTFLLTTTQGYESHPSWSPDGGQIAYLYSVSGDSRHELWLMNIATKESQRLIDFPVTFGRIAWSPKEDLIAFVSTEKAEQCGDIYTVRSDGSKLTRLTDLSGCATDVVWSPDGNYLAFIGRNQTKGNIMNWGWQIYVVDSNGRDIVAVTNEKEWVIKDIDWTSISDVR